MGDAHQAGDVVPANAPSTGSTQSCTVEIVPRHLKMHSVSETELDAIASGGGSINLTFFGICIGAAISFGIVLRTTNLEAFNKALFWMLFGAALLMGTYFGVFGIRDYRASKQKLKDIKGGKVTLSSST